MRIPQSAHNTAQPMQAPWYSVGLYDLGLHLLFIGNFCLLFYSRTIYRSSSVFIALGSLALLWGAIVGIQKRWARLTIPTSVQIAALFMPFVLIVLVMASVQNPVSWYYKPVKFFPYMWALVALAGVTEIEWTRLKRVFRIHALIGSIIFLTLLSTGFSWEYTRRDAFLQEGAGMYESITPLLWSRQLMYSFCILLLLLPQEKLFWQIVAVGSTLSMTVYAILSQFRSILVLNVGLTILFAFYCWQRTGTINKSRKLIAALLVGGCLIGGVYFVSHSSSTHADVLRKAFSQILDRFTGSGSRGDLSTATWKEGRFDDALYYLKTLSISRLILGDKGFWESSEGIAIHPEHVRYIVHGGIFMMLSAWLLIYWQGWWGLVFSRHLPVLAAASVAAMHSIQAIPAGMLLTVPNSALIFLCAGYCWRSMALERSLNKNTINPAIAVR